MRHFLFYLLTLFSSFIRFEFGSFLSNQRVFGHALEVFIGAGLKVMNKRVFGLGLSDPVRISS
jgi:hypothetical protein